MGVCDDGAGARGRGDAGAGGAGGGGGGDVQRAGSDKHAVWLVYFSFFSALVKDVDGCILWCSDWCPWVRLQASILPSCARCISSL